MMQITAKFIFQLPFALKMKEVRNIMPKSIKRGDKEIIIYPPMHTKKDTTEKPFSQLKTPKPRKTQLDKLNCIVIDIRRDLQTIQQVEQASEALLSEARKILYQLLNLCRKRKIPHIGNINVEKLDYRMRFFDTNGNRIRDTGQTNLTLQTPAFESGKWADICQDLASGNLPEIYEILILDAYSVVSTEPRRAILDASTAREVYVKRFYKSNNKRKSAIKLLRENKPELMEKLDCLQKTNILVKHEGLCGYNDKKGRFTEVDYKRAWEFIQAVQDAIEYTRSLESK